MVMMPKLEDIMNWIRGKVIPTNFRSSLYYVHPDEKLFVKHFRIDLTAPDAPEDATGDFVVMEFTVPKSQVWIVKGFAPYAMERTDATGLTESARYIDPRDGNDWLVFTPLAAGAAPFVIETNLNAPQNIGGAGQANSQRQTLNGIAQITLTPYVDAMKGFVNPFFSMEVKSETTFKVTFALSGPPASADPIKNPYVIGNPTAPGTQRVDFAGVFVTGVMLSETAYAEVEDQFKK